MNRKFYIYFILVIIATTTIIIFLIISIINMKNLSRDINDYIYILIR